MQYLTRSFGLGCCLFLILHEAHSADKPTALSVGVRSGTYSGWSNSFFFNSDDVAARAVVVPAIGGRIIHYGRGGENIIFESPGSEGKTLANSRSGFWAGGYQCDIGPEIRGIPDHPKLWIGQYLGESPKEYTVHVASEPDAQLGVQLEKEILFAPESGEIGITQRMKNISDREISYCLWDRTLCKGSGFVMFPLNKKSRFPAGWSLRRTIEGKYQYDGDKPTCPMVRIIGGVLVAEAKGEPTKIGADSTVGWIAYVRGKLLLVKYYPYFPDGNYSDGGNSVETYWDQQVAELEPLSPEKPLSPGASYEFPEKWVITLLKKEVTTPEQARSLVSKIPPNPFSQ